ncbi:hypothetical protein [Sinorhizobium meliloti]|uniref:hypothetical protein n=1 Tax=Rhizobium meliloti TaxID=382 RepID=UPI000FDAD996|nr:hypothetical protein [Sinorhizobium meliloti]
MADEGLQPLRPPFVPVDQPFSPPHEVRPAAEHHLSIGPDLPLQDAEARRAMHRPAIEEITLCEADLDHLRAALFRYASIHPTSWNLRTRPDRRRLHATKLAQVGGVFGD